MIAAVGGFEARIGRRVIAGRPVTGTADEGSSASAPLPPRRLLAGEAMAVVTDLAGADAPLSSERRYVRSILPRGIWRELRHGGFTGALRAGGIVAGLALPAGAYVQARLAVRFRRGCRGVG
jgi:hypothetical protein